MACWDRQWRRSSALATLPADVHPILSHHVAHGAPPPVYGASDLPDAVAAAALVNGLASPTVATPFHPVHQPALVVDHAHHLAPRSGQRRTCDIAVFAVVALRGGRTPVVATERVVLLVIAALTLGCRSASAADIAPLRRRLVAPSRRRRPLRDAGRIDVDGVRPSSATEAALHDPAPLSVGGGLRRAANRQWLY